MDNRSLRALEFNKVIDRLKSFGINYETKERIENLKPLTNKNEINKLLDYLDEAIALILRTGKAPMGKVENILPYLGRARIQATLSMNELLNIAGLLRVVKDLNSFYNEDKDNEGVSPLLDDLFFRLDTCGDLERSISKKILGLGEMADTASRKLAEIRREKFLKNKRISEKLDSIINSSSNDKYLQDKFVSIRNGRYVVPVKAEYKSKVPGAVLDRSTTGSTLFIEPIAVLEMNNELRELEIEEQKEIERILKALTQEVDLYNEVLRTDYETLIDLDFLLAKANYALKTNSTRAQFSLDNSINLKKARHPLIDDEQVVSSSIKIPSETNALVITGPNTGGKTVTLKTLGLLSVMLQSGLFIPVRSGSSTRLFSNVFADIGDEQSIEQNLSTFSSHMTNIVEILNGVDKNSLVLFDELGAGTDPVEGAALAISILDYLKKDGIFTAATTHYPEIKEFALNEDDVLNASMEFNVNTLAPTYRLLIGLPGKSNAFEIAARLNLPENIIESSKSRVSGKYLELDNTLEKAQNELSSARKEQRKAYKLRKEAESINSQAKDKEKKLEQKRDKIISEAIKESERILAQTKKETDQIYKEIQRIQRESEAKIDNKKLESLRKDIKREEERLEKRKRNRLPKEAHKKYQLKDFNKGDRVYIKSLDREAEVTKVLEKEKKIEISSGSIRIKFKPEDLVIINNRKRSETKVSFSRPKAKIKKELDLRGKTKDEARELIDDFINEALLLDQKKFTIIHGFGTGQVRKVVQDYLKNCKFVESYRLGGPGEGGAGATIIELK